MGKPDFILDQHDKVDMLSTYDKTVRIRIFETWLFCQIKAPFQEHLRYNHWFSGT